MADFQTAYKITRAHEGGYANNPNDRGGETYKGIARKIFPQWSGWNHIDQIKKKAGSSATAIDKEAEKDATLQSVVHAFYKAEFWNRLNLDSVNNQAIANELFDTGVNMGVGVAGLFLQRVLNVCNRGGKEYNDLPLTGNVGQLTLNALNHHKRQSEILKALNCLQGAKYIGICEANPSQEVFMSGWLSRVAL